MFFWIFCGTQVLQNGSVSAYTSNLADIQTQTRGTSKLAAGYNASLQGVIPIVLTPAVGYFFDRFGWRMFFGGISLGLLHAGHPLTCSVLDGCPVHHSFRPDRLDDRPSSGAHPYLLVCLVLQRHHLPLRNSRSGRERCHAWYGYGRVEGLPKHQLDNYGRRSRSYCKLP